MTKHFQDVLELIDENIICHLQLDMLNDGSTNLITNSTEFSHTIPRDVDARMIIRIERLQNALDETLYYCDFYQTSHAYGVRWHYFTCKRVIGYECWSPDTEGYLRGHITFQSEDGFLRHINISSITTIGMHILASKFLISLS
ncbi:MAG: hypothetical protein EBV19_08895 [Flavobacteriia bacterium]|nr:hypothetical protein [Flavobacteriia bacterium]